MEFSTLEYGIFGFVLTAASAIVGVLWKLILKLLAQIEELQKYHTDRYDELSKHYEERHLEQSGRYEGLVKELAAQQTDLQNTLEQLQEGLSTKDLFTEYIVRRQQGEEGGD